jgi:hypothetical protein
MVSQSVSDQSGGKQFLWAVQDTRVGSSLWLLGGSDDFAALVLQVHLRMCTCVLRLGGMTCAPYPSHCNVGTPVHLGGLPVRDAWLRFDAQLDAAIPTQARCKSLSKGQQLDTAATSCVRAHHHKVGCIATHAACVAVVCFQWAGRWLKSGKALVSTAKACCLDVGQR